MIVGVGDCARCAAAAVVAWLFAAEGRWCWWVRLLGGCPVLRLLLRASLSPGVAGVARSRVAVAGRRLLVLLPLLDCAVGPSRLPPWLCGCSLRGVFAACAFVGGGASAVVECHGSSALLSAFLVSFAGWL